jgi:hypothetical protein
MSTSTISHAGLDHFKDDAGDTWISLAQTMKLLPGVARPTLCTWRKRCPLIDGPLKMWKEGRACWFREDLVLLLKERMKDRRQGVYRKDGQVFYTPAALLKRGIDEYRRDLLLRAGRLESESFPQRHGRPTRPELDGRVIAYRFVGPNDDGALPPVRFNGVYTRDDGRKARNVKAASAWMLLKGCPCSRSDLRRYLREGRCDYLAEGRLPSLPMKRHDRNLIEPTILEEDLKRLRQAMFKAQQAGRAAGREDGLVTAQDLEKLFQLRGRGPRQRLGVLLYRLAETGQLKRSKTKRFSKKKRQWYKPWGYRLEDFQRLLAGRTLTDVLEELAPWLDRSNVAEFPRLLEDLMGKPTQSTPNEPETVRAPRATAQKNQGAGATKPRWDEMTATLFWGDTAIREFRKHPAQNQRELIEAFHREGWAHTIPDPFGEPRKLNQTLKDLNRKLPPNTVRFCGDGMGLGAIWEPV